jgi:hypothetical protein
MKDIINILRDIYSKQIQVSKCQNERYLHHFFSNKLQTINISSSSSKLNEYKYKIIYDDIEDSNLHPEWPSKKIIRNNQGPNYGKYRYDKKNKEYVVDEQGRAGFIDFAIGEYDKPEIGIEFTTSFGWKGEAIIFDMMKLMDSKNPFKKSISYNIVFREKGLSEITEKIPSHYQNFKNAINKSLETCKIKLNGRYDNTKEYLFWIIEIGENETRSWYCSNFSILKKPSQKEFEIGNPEPK